MMNLHLKSLHSQENPSLFSDSNQSEKKGKLKPIKIIKPLIL